MPQLILSVPFDVITKSNSIEDEYSIEYYMYDMSKIYNNRIQKKLIINSDIEDSLYYYDIRLYRFKLLFEKNKMYSDSLLNSFISITCYTTNSFCYAIQKAYGCDYVINPLNHKCKDYNTIIGETPALKTYILVPGINAKTNKIGMLTEVCYQANDDGGIDNVNCFRGNDMTEYQCIKSDSTTFLPLFDACISRSGNTLGYFYYSYFFKLPPIKINLKSYNGYFIQFNFLYETNKALRPKSNLKGKKLYLFYTDAFRIWHDYCMKYIGIEDNQGNPSKNLIPNFNPENENLFTISVNYNEVTDVYTGKVFLNGVKIYMPTFSGGQLNYILFCHNDSACPVNNEIYWTSGFYNQIRIYELSGISVLNENSFYEQYIYHNYYSYYNYENSNERFDSYPVTEEIKMNLESFSIENKIGDYTITSYYENVDKMQIFNYGIDQTDSLRNYIKNQYINTDFHSIPCSGSLSCYGVGDGDDTNIFSKQAKVCGDRAYYKYDNCEEFPSSKDNYYSLSLPLKEDLNMMNIPYTLTLIKCKNIPSTNNLKSGKITFTFWLKLIAFKEAQKIFQTGEDPDYCYLEYKEINKLYFICYNGINEKFNNSYTIQKFNYGKYMHINIAISMHKYYEGHDFFICFQVNNENVGYQDENSKNDLNGDITYAINIQKFTLFTQIYGQITKFYIYNEALIGGYAFNTNYYFNSYFNSEPKITLIDDTRQNCLLENPDTNSYYNAYKCITDYNPVFNDDLYINSGYPYEKKVFLSKNNKIKIKKCSDNCGSSCYGENEDQCACATKSYFNYILKIDDFSYKCKNLPYLDFKRYEYVKCQFPSTTLEGFDFWFYLAKGVRYYGNEKDLFFISFDDEAMITITQFKIKSLDIESPDFVFLFNIWIHVYWHLENSRHYLEFTSDDNSINFSKDKPIEWTGTYSSIKFANNEQITSPGIIQIRQFKLWKYISKKKKEMDYI